MDIKCSIVIPVLQSYEPLRRQLLYFEQFLPDDWEVIVMDDGSDLPIMEDPNDYNYHLKIVPTGDYRNWSQPAARNAGVKLAKGKYIFMPAVDHIVTPDVVQCINAEKFIRMNFYRHWGVLEYTDDSKKDVIIKTDFATLQRYGLKENLIGRKTVPYDIYAMRKDIWLEIGGYDESFVGKYGGDDVAFAKEYAKYIDGKVRENPEKKPDYEIRLRDLIYVYPDPARDLLGLFHNLKR